MGDFPCLMFPRVSARDSNFQNLKSSGVTPPDFHPRSQVLGQSLDTPCLERDSRCPFHSARGGGEGEGGEGVRGIQRFGSPAFIRGTCDIRSGSSGYVCFLGLSESDSVTAVVIL